MPGGTVGSRPSPLKQAPAVSRLRSIGPFGQDRLWRVGDPPGYRVIHEVGRPKPRIRTVFHDSSTDPGGRARDRQPRPMPGRIAGRTKTPEGTNRSVGPWPPMQAPATRSHRIRPVLVAADASTCVAAAGPFMAPSGKTYCTGDLRGLATGLSTNFAGPTTNIGRFSTVRPRNRVGVWVRGRSGPRGQPVVSRSGVRPRAARWRRRAARPDRPRRVGPCGPPRRRP